MNCLPPILELWLELVYDQAYLCELMESRIATSKICSFLNAMNPGYVCRYF